MDLDYDERMDDYWRTYDDDKSSEDTYNWDNDFPIYSQFLNLIENSDLETVKKFITENEEELYSDDDYGYRL